MFVFFAGMAVIAIVGLAVVEHVFGDNAPNGYVSTWTNPRTGQKSYLANNLTGDGYWYSYSASDAAIFETREAAEKVTPKYPTPGVVEEV